MNKLPRSLRNNNPFNIKKSSSRWLGKVKGKDKVFETFDSMDHGVRAGLKLILNYVKQGYNTPRKIIARFAPSSENDTKSYIDFVCDNLYLSPDIFLKNTSFFLFFCYRIITYECGLTPYQLELLGIDFAYIRDIFVKYNFKLNDYEKD